MPIYEEKIICPLALRFSQDHIRPEFQGRATDIEAAIKAIKTKPGTGDYDIVLVPPFPAIEIIRGHLKGGSDDSDHWLSLDNRRLYCLQRAAAAHWPLRVAVEVEALRSPTEGMRKKVNSSVDGLSVGIGHSWHSLIGRWDWHEAVGDVAGKAPAALVALDDARVCVQDLCDAPAAPSMLDLFFQNEKTGAPSDSSTVEPRSPRSSEGSNDSSLVNVVDVAASGWKQSTGYDTLDISGAWEDDKGNTYNVTAVPEEWSWTLVRKNSAGSRRKFTLWYDEATDSVSWGDDWTCWAAGADMRKSNTYLSWWGRDAAARKPRFWWSRVQSQKSAPQQTQSSKSSKKVTRS